ncbi:hypothetical protein PAPHI01_2576 [Pancytospora philotis]|nr:hypothetical protein PAPHI01_2576 [Pancytospora philotis]
MLATAWSVYAILPLGMLGAVMGAHSEGAQLEHASTSDHWFNPNCEFLNYEKKQSRVLMRDFVRRMSIDASNADPEVLQLRESAEFMQLCRSVVNNNFSDIGSARLSVFALLSAYPVLYKHLMGSDEDPVVALNLNKFFTGEKPAPPLSLCERVPEFEDFMRKIRNIFRDIRTTERFNYEYLITHGANCALNIVAALVIRSNWKQEEIGNEINKLCAALCATCDSKQLFETVVEPLVATLCGIKILEHEARCKTLLGTLLEVGIKVSTLADIQFFNAGAMNSVTRRYLVAALADVCKRYARTGLPDTTALPAWCYRHRKLLREHPDDIFAALWHSYSRRAEAYCSFADSVKYMFLRKRARDPFIPDLPPQIGYLLLYFMKSEALKTTYSEADQQTVRDLFFAKLGVDKLAAVLCLEALDEDNCKDYLRKQLLRLSIGHRMLLSVEISSRELTKFIFTSTDLFDELAMDDKLSMIAHILAEMDGGAEQ